MQRSYSQTIKAVRARESRSRQGTERRFNVPLREFLNHKYPAIYAEYTELFNLMITEHPNRRNLVTSTTFKQWLATNPKQPVSSSTTTIPQHPCSDIINQALQGAFAKETPGQNNHQNPQQTIDHLPVEQGLAENENIPVEPVEQDPAENENIPVEQDPTADEIINEMLIDADLRNMLE